MRVLATCASTLIVLAGVALTARSQEPGEGRYGEAEAPEGLEPPMRVYRHTSAMGHAGVFTLQGRQGRARYWFNNQPHEDDLRFDKARRLLDGTKGWSYRVVRDGEPRNLWFFFAAESYTEIDDHPVYKMYFSQMPNDDNGKKFWNRILVPNGTRMKPIEDEGAN